MTQLGRDAFLCASNAAFVLSEPWGFVGGRLTLPAIGRFTHDPNHTGTVTRW